MDFYSRALELAEDLGDRTGIATVNSGLVAGYNHLGDTESAIHSSDKALDASRQIGDSGVEAATRGNLARVFEARGDFVRAAEQDARRLEILLAQGDRYDSRHSSSLAASSTKWATGKSGGVRRKITGNLRGDGCARCHDGAGRDGQVDEMRIDTHCEAVPRTHLSISDRDDNI